MLKNFLLLLIFASNLCLAEISDPKNFRSPPCKFIENKGQLMDGNGKPVPFVLFRSAAPGIDYYITTTGITYVFSRLSEEEEKESEEQVQPLKEKGKSGSVAALVETEKVELLLQNANILQANIVREGASDFHYNYFYAHCPQGIYDVKEYEKITIRDIYPGIDWVLYGSSAKGLKYDFIIHPGADAALIRLVYRSNKQAHLGDKGDIIIKTSLGRLSESSPISYLENSKQKINSEFRLISKSRIPKGYETLFQFYGEFDKYKDQKIVIDPQLVWATFYGGSLLDGPMAIETDAAGNVFTCGYTYSTNYPVNNNGTFFQSTNANIANFITKFSSTGALNWSTYYGSNNPEREPKGLEIDKFGNVYVAGETYASSFPLQNNGGYFQTTTSAPVSSEIFLLKFTNSGLRLWATLFGGGSFDSVNFIDTDSLGNLYIGGRTFSTNFPLSNAGGYYQSSYFATNAGIGILAKFDANCNLLWSTYFGNYYSIVTAVNCDKFNNLYITGACSGVGVPTVNPGGSAYIQPSGGATNYTTTCFISKFNPQTNLVWSTQYGGSGTQMGYAIITDSIGNLFVAGRSTSGNFPLQFSTSTYSQSNVSSSVRAFILKFNGSGVRQWASFCGGEINAAFDTFDNLAIDPCNQDVYLTFSTLTNSLLSQASCDGGYFKPILLNTAAAAAFTSNDVALLKFSNAGALVWSTYLGGNRDAFRSSVVCDHNSNLYMTGEWTSAVANTFPVTNPGNGAYYVGAHNGGQDDGYLVKFSPSNVAGTPTFTYAAPICNSSSTVAPNLSLGITGNFSATPGLSIHPLTGIINIGASVLGTYTVTFTPNSCGCLASASKTCIVTLAGAPTASISTPTTSVCAGNAIVLQATLLTPNTTYTWLPGGSTNQSISITPLSTTTYSLKVRDTVSGCSTTYTLPLVVYSNPTVNILGADSVCSAGSVVLASTFTGSNTWSTGQSGSSITVSPLLTTIYTLTGTNANGCFGQAAHTIFVLASPTLVVSGPTSACIGAAISLTATGATSYTWNNSFSANVFTTVLNQSASVSIIGTAVNGCQSTQTISLLALECTGLFETKNTNAFFQIYPNPSSGEITVRCKQPAELQLEDASGKLIHTFLFETESQLFTLKLSEGVYFLSGNINGKWLTEKILITH